LKELRAQKGLSQSELAKRAKMNAAGIAKLEQGVREPSWATVLTLAAALKVNVESFVPVTPGRVWRSSPISPAKRVRPDEGRLGEATALLRAVHDDPSAVAGWGVLADWLADRELQAELYCRRRMAYLEHAARKPNNLPTGKRHRDRRREATRAWEAERANIERQYG
jgi:transcriptional regulator with XRE-family HTH domain